MAETVKPVAWIGSTKKDLLAMPEAVQKTGRVHPVSGAVRQDAA
jgi:phage-related protein